MDGVFEGNVKEQAPSPSERASARAEVTARETRIARDVAARLTRGNVRIQDGRFTTLEQFERERARLAEMRFDP